MSEILLYKFEKKKELLKDEVTIYRLEENILDYVLFIIRELTGKLDILRN